jgi:hypothetical protein
MTRHVPPHGVSIIRATEDVHLFARWFKRRESWAAWFAFLRVLFGLPLGEGELETFLHVLGARSRRPEGRGRLTSSAGGGQAKASPWPLPPYISRASRIGAGVLLLGSAER